MIEVIDYSAAIYEGYKNDGSVHRSFYPSTPTCPFCNRDLNKVFSKAIIEYDPDDKDSTKDIHHSMTASSCSCGWWKVEHLETPDAHNLYASPAWFFSYRGVLRRFSVDDVTVPMEALRRAIAKRPDALDEISPRKMEELVGAVMSDFWPGSKCTLCGKSGDGGVDLILVINDKPFAVQVKHRENPKKGESVHHVTHFIGALMLNDIPNGVFVTSANHFSRQAEEAAATILERGHVESFELVARGAFLEMLRATRRHLSDPWRKCIPNSLLGESGRLTPYSINLRPPGVK